MISLRKVLLTALLAQLSHAATSPSKTGGVSGASSTCPSRTVNYITHGLPQQCLTSSRTVNSNSANTTSLQTPPILTTIDEHAPTNANHITSETDESNVPTLEARSGGPTSTLDLPKPMEDRINTESIIPESQPVVPSEAPKSPVAVQIASEEAEADSLLDNAKFLSFEEWKKQNLLKAGQSEHIGTGRRNEPRDPGKRANPVLQQGLDSIGDDAEIDLDFTGFVADREDLAPPRQPVRAANDDRRPEMEPEAALPKNTRSKDAGTTCKERYNYASFDCAATVLKTNSKAKGEKYVLLENKDSYMLNECSAHNKFLILELCDDISIDTIVLANFEFFSSIFRMFRVSVSDKYPVKTDKWITLGTFEARNTREIQAFLIENPMIWARYVRIEFLTHYGSEFYCPLSLVRVHGTTMMDDYMHDQQKRRGDGDSEDGNENSELPEPEEALIPEAVAQVLVEEKSRSEEAERALKTPQPANISGDVRQNSPTANENSMLEIVSNMTSPNNQSETIFVTATEICSMLNATEHQREPASTSKMESATATPIIAIHNQTIVSESAGSRLSNPPPSAPSNSPNATELLKTTGSSPTALNTTNLVSNSTSAKPTNTTALEKSRAPPSSTQAQAASPTIQESFFKSVQKRLQTLESNSSLSLQYIEEQSRALRDAFARVEQKQLSKTSTFLDYLNTTVLNELRDFRQQYDQLWQSTVIELESQREQYQQEALAINTRFAILADELVFQKRMSILQMVLIVICLGLVLFPRGPLNNYVDLPIVQNMLARSPSRRWISVSGLQTPSTSPPQTRPNSSHRIKVSNGVLKRRDIARFNNSEDSEIHQTGSYSPLTPVSNEGHSDAEGALGHLAPESPTYDPVDIERPNTSPPVLPSSNGNTTPEFVALRDETIDSRLHHETSLAINETAKELPEFTLRPATPTKIHSTFELPGG